MADTRQTVNARYLSARQSNTGFLSYALSRRTQKLISTIEKLLPSVERERLDVVDFGCADASMLVATAQALGDRYGSGTGLDVFRMGTPPDSNGMRFLAVDLFKTYPYPLDEASCDVAIASAFVKHHPDNRLFLGEVGRVLRPGGFVVMLDPRPFVVKVGMVVGKFSRNYNPSLWSHQSIDDIVRNAGINLRIESFERYWVAPVRSLYNTGIENILPRQLMNVLALQQCMVLRRV